MGSTIKVFSDFTDNRINLSCHVEDKCNIKTFIEHHCKAF